MRKQYWSIVVYWYAQAAIKGDVIAQYNLGAMVESLMTPEQIDESQRRTSAWVKLNPR